MTKILISVVGPTAIGKTSLAIALAKHFNTNILSADSRQFYKEMKIGTAVPSDKELKSAPHHFIQHKSVRENYSVGDFEKEALQLLNNLFQEKDIIIMVGGSGLYVDAVTKGLDRFPEVDSAIRTQLNDVLNQKGIAALQQQLKQLDPEYYQRVDLENPHRLIRALEVCISSKQPYSSFIGQNKATRPFKTITIGITAEREIIYNRIEQRVDLMLAEGLLKEVQSVYPHKHLNALQTVGYKELFKYIDGEWEFDFAISEIKKNTRRFAKRQLTWFRKTANILWVDYMTDISETTQQLEAKIKKMKQKNAPLCIVLGVSGCGKSTVGKLLANALEVPFFDGDDYHPEVNVKKMASGNPLNDADREGWLHRLNRLALENQNKGAVIACSALKASYRAILSQQLSDKMEFVYLKGTFEEIFERLNTRENHFMPPDLLKSQFDALEEPQDAIEIPISNTPAEMVQNILTQLHKKGPNKNC